MPRKRHKPEEIVAKLRQVDVLISQGTSGRGRRAIDRSDRGDVLSLAPGVRRAEGGSGQAAEGAWRRRTPGCARRCPI